MGVLTNKQHYGMATIYKEKLKAFGKKNGWDVVEYRGKVDGIDIYRFRDSEIPLSGKRGYPILFSITEDGEIYELNSAQIHRYLSLHSEFCEVLD